MFLGLGPALNCDQDMFRLQLRYSGGTSNLGVDAGLRVRLSSSLHADGFEGWCSPRCFGPPAASGSCCGDGGLPRVGASWGVPAFKRARGRLPSGPEDRPRLHKKWTSLLDKQVD